MFDIFEPILEHISCVQNRILSSCLLKSMFYNIGSMYEIQMHCVHHVVTVTWPTQILPWPHLCTILPYMNAIGLDILVFSHTVFHLFFSS